MLTQIILYVVITIYLLCLTLIVVYSAGQFHLILTFLKHRKDAEPMLPWVGDQQLSFVTIQLPVYNESYVIRRLLQAVSDLDYPRQSYEIQVLDDSDDETTEIIVQEVERLTSEGINIYHIRRPKRSGYKAGALGYGLNTAQGDYIAIFDADFVPNSDFLRSLLPYFDEENVGVVQARWEHLNQDYSIFTEVQAFHLDAHFTIEQFSRYKGNLYMNFNGTAGIWRKECIIDAGGWEFDTLTEDLDLSYRAQLKGWKFKYVDQVGAPAELPAEMGGIKSQQYRWMKGGAEVARKMLKHLWKSDSSLIKKIHGSFHLLSSSVFIVVLMLGTTTVPLLYIKHEFWGGSFRALLIPVSFLLVSFGILSCLYLITFRVREGSIKAALKRFVVHFIPFLSFSMGLSLHNSMAVIQGYWGKKTPFIRTPKYNILKRKDSWQSKKYFSRKINPIVFMELLLTLYFSYGLYLAIQFRDVSIMPYFIMQILGFGAVSIVSLKHALKHS